MQNPKLTHIHRVKRWRVISLALAAFIFNTSEFIPVALLSDMADSFALPVADVGLMITLYAWIVAVLSVPAVLITARIERRKLLMGVFGLFVISHGVSALASSFTLLLLSRTGVALAHATFWSITASLVVRVAGKGRQTQALGMLATGSALAVVLGLPLGRVVGQYLGWRTTFGLIGGMAVITMGVLWWLLPNLPSKNTGSLASLSTLWKNTALVTVYALLAVLITAHFTAYSYIEPFAKQINHLSDNWTTGILLIFGVAGMVASALYSRFYEAYPRAFFNGAMLMLIVSLVAMGFMNGVMSWAALAIMWGIAIMVIGLALQVRVMRLAPQSSDVAMAIFSGIYNVGIGGGALLGNVVISQLGLNNVGNVGAMVALLAVAILVLQYNKQNLANKHRHKA